MTRIRIDQITNDEIQKILEFDNTKREVYENITKFEWLLKDEKYSDVTSNAT